MLYASLLYYQHKTRPAFQIDCQSEYHYSFLSTLLYIFTMWTLQPCVLMILQLQYPVNPQSFMQIMELYFILLCILFKVFFHVLATLFKINKEAKIKCLVSICPTSYNISQCILNIITLS